MICRKGRQIAVHEIAKQESPCYDFHGLNGLLDDDRKSDVE